jgi:hypothetical protein
MVCAIDIEELGTATDRRIGLLVAAVVVAYTIATIASTGGHHVRSMSVGVEDKLDGGSAEKSFVETVKIFRGKTVCVYTDPQRGHAGSPPCLKGFGDGLHFTQMRVQIAVEVQDVQIVFWLQAKKIADGGVVTDLRATDQTTIPRICLEPPCYLRS